MACIQCNHFDGTRCWKHRFSVCCPDKFECREIAEKDGEKVITELIKPCPFCGGEVKISTEQVDAVTEVYNFVCSSCDSYTYFDYCDREESIETWNNRVTEADIRAKVIDEFAKRLHSLCGMQIGEYSYPDLLYRNCIDEVADELKEEQ